MAEINVEKSRRVEKSSHNITTERFKRSHYGNLILSENFLNFRNIDLHYNTKLSDFSLTILSNYNGSENPGQTR